MANEVARLPWDAVAVTPSDTIAIGGALGLYVGGAGNVSVITRAASEKQARDGVAAVAVTFVAVPAGTTLPIAVSRVNSTLTTATNIVAYRGGIY